MQAAATILTKRVAEIPGAVVHVESATEIDITAPTDKLTVFDGLTDSAKLNIRPVVDADACPANQLGIAICAWASPDLTAATGTATTQTAVTTPTSAPPLSEFPVGSGPKMPIQPAAKDKSGWAAWMTAAEGYAINRAGPTCAEIDYYAGMDDPDRPLLACDASGTIYLLQPTLVPGTEISDATSGSDTQNGQGWIVNVTFRSGGLAIWSTYTANNIGAQTAFTLDGEVVSAPVIQQPITTATTTISGSFTQQSANALADSLKFGALPLSFDVTVVRMSSGG